MDLLNPVDYPGMRAVAGERFQKLTNFLIQMTRSSLSDVSEPQNDAHGSFLLFLTNIFLYSNKIKGKSIKV